jgi:hypothetical protein
MSPVRSHISFWDYTKKSARNATTEFFRPIIAFSPERRKTNSRVARAADTAEQVKDDVDSDMEVIDHGRAHWEEFVNRGKSLVGDQATRVAAAVEAGREAYRTTAAKPE